MKKIESTTEIKENGSSNWKKIDLVDTISFWPNRESICSDPGDYEVIVKGYTTIAIGFIGGNEMYVYDVRLNGGRSLREQWEGDCNG